MKSTIITAVLALSLMLAGCAGGPTGGQTNGGPTTANTPGGATSATTNSNASAAPTSQAP